MSNYALIPGKTVKVPTTPKRDVSPLQQEVNEVAIQHLFELMVTPLMDYLNGEGLGQLTEEDGDRVCNVLQAAGRLIGNLESECFAHGVPRAMVDASLRTGFENLLVSMERDNEGCQQAGCPKTQSILFLRSRLERMGYAAQKPPRKVRERRKLSRGPVAQKRPTQLESADRPGWVPPARRHRDKT